MKGEPLQRPAGFRAGFVALVGRPNVGKSTLFNRLLGDKLAIVSDKPQTTRDRILGILNQTAAQLILLDCPGLVQQEKGLGRHFQETLWQSVADADLILLIDDLERRWAGEENRALAKRLKESGKPLWLAVNKIDLATSRQLEERVEELKAAYPGCEIHRLSARRGDGVDLLRRSLIQALPLHPPFYSPEELTDLPERFFAAETIREKAFEHLYQELPYSLAVQVRQFSESPERIEIDADLIVEKESQKGMVIGRGGQMIKVIGQSARAELEKVYQRPVLLRLQVRLDKNWTKLPQKRRELGYR